MLTMVKQGHVQKASSGKELSNIISIEAKGEACMLISPSLERSPGNKMNGGNVLTAMQFTLQYLPNRNPRQNIESADFQLSKFGDSRSPHPSFTSIMPSRVEDICDQLHCPEIAMDPGWGRETFHPLSDLVYQEDQRRKNMLPGLTRHKTHCLYDLWRT